MNDRVPNELLVEAGLDLMRRAGKPMEEVPTKGRAMIYRMSSGETVRIRTCNDHLLVVRADRDAEDANLNVEGTDHVLIVMPKQPRTHGEVVAYLVPAGVAADAARVTHREWRASNPNTKGDNKTWNLWFDDDGAPKASGFAKKWARYRLAGSSSTSPPAGPPTFPAPGGNTLGQVIASAKQQIADVAGVPLSAVKISVDLSG